MVDVGLGGMLDPVSGTGSEAGVGGGADNVGVGVDECKDRGEAEIDLLLFVGSLLRIELIDVLRGILELPNPCVRDGVRNLV
jgi:hypothetical protein